MPEQWGKKAHHTFRRDMASFPVCHWCRRAKGKNRFGCHGAGGILHGTYQRQQQFRL